MPSKCWKHSAGSRPNTVTVFEREPGGMIYARAWNARPVTVEVGDQPLHHLAPRAMVECRTVGELILRDVHRRIGVAPAPPCLLRAE